MAWITLRSSFQDLKILKLANQERILLLLLLLLFLPKSHSVGSMKKINGNISVCLVVISEDMAKF